MLPFIKQANSEYLTFTEEIPENLELINKS
jgi:hypothetical protein